MAVYLAAAVIASVLLAGGLVMMKSRAAILPKASGIGVPRAVWTWLRDPMWIGGLGVQLLGYGFYVDAVTGAPISVVAVMMQGGIAIFVLFAVLILGEQASLRELIGIGVIVVAMVLLSSSLFAGESNDVMSWSSLTWFSALLLAVGLAPGAAPRLRETGIAAAILSGVAFGLGALFTKAMTIDFIARDSSGVLFRIATNPYAYLATAANLSGVILLQNAFHTARGIVALPISSAISNLVPIAGGLLAFGESLPSNTVAAAMRILSFVLTITAGGLLAGSQEKPAASPRPAVLST